MNYHLKGPPSFEHPQLKIEIYFDFDFSIAIEFYFDRAIARPLQNGPLVLAKSTGHAIRPHRRTELLNFGWVGGFHFRRTHPPGDPPPHPPLHLDLLENVDLGPHVDLRSTFRTPPKSYIFYTESTTGGLLMAGPPYPV